MKFLFVGAVLAFASPSFANLDLGKFIQGTDLVSGKKEKIEFSKGEKGTVVVFLSAKCPCSKSHEAPLKELQTEYSKAGFQFVAINSNANEGEAESKKHFQAAGLGMSVLRDAKAEIADRFGALKTPHVFVVSADSKLIYQGGIDDSSDASEAKKHYLKDVLISLKSGQEPKLKEARALGCQIRRPEGA